MRAIAGMARSYKGTPEQKARHMVGPVLIHLFLQKSLIPFATWL